MYFKISNKEGKQILQELSVELGCPNNLDRADRTLKSVLLAFRGNVSFERSLELLDVLPLSLKSLFVEHWVVPQEQPDSELDLDELISESRRLDKHSSIQDFTTRDEAQHAVYAVFRVIGRHLGKEELKLMVDVLAYALPGHF
jgi:uncharacterized protein (DUF2267 family)